MDEMELRRLALIGARARLVEIDTERDKLIAAFPELSKRAPRSGGNSTASDGPRVLYTAPDRTRRSWDEKSKRDVLARYQNGESAENLAAELGIHKGRIYKWAQRFGMQKVAAPPGPEATPRDIALHRLGQGESAAKVAREMDVAPSTVRGWMKQSKLTKVRASHDGSGKVGAWMPGTLAILKEHPDSDVATLSGLLGMRLDSTNYRLQQLRTKGLALQSKEKTWTLSAKGNAALETASRDA